ncbi:MAG: hypothetical protein LBE30_06650 [Comamonas sp.]|jgi:hypothetical protein|nr:hypothetical protein [Comamonas sp.]
MTPTQRLQAALQSEPAAAAALARALRDEGMAQTALYRLYQAEHVRSDLAEPQLDALADAMDLIWGGGWAKSHALFPQELSQERLNKE